jgi:hypothetical protein
MNGKFLLAFAIVVIQGLISNAHAQVTVTIDHNPAGTGNFNFNRVPTPVKDDAGARAKWLLLVGELDPNAVGFNALNDGLLPANQDQPTANFFFSAGSTGGRFRLDLGKLVEISQVNSYSWHPNSRGPQVYLLYASDGADPKFNAEPKGYVDPTTAGWKLLTIVDTRQKFGRLGGQYGVSVAAADGALGKYRYLLFDTVATETDDDWGNTFYSEIDVIEEGASPFEIACR